MVHPKSVGWLVALLLITTPQAVFAAEPIAPKSAPGLPVGWLIASVGILFLLVLLFVAYMFYLQRQFLAACREDNQITVFFQTPAGLPAGTIRSIMTLIIVAFALYLLILTMFMGPQAKFPEVMAAILSTVIGFYFGSRSASGSGRDSTLTDELTRVRQQKDEAVAARDENAATGLLKKVGKGVTLAKTVVDMLPEEVQKKYSGTMEKLQRGAQVAEALFTKGDAQGASTQAEEVFTLFKQDNPLRGVVTQALSSFARVAGVSVPPIALISAVVGISTTLIGTAYARWKARILRLPFSPASVPLKRVDADTGFVLAMQSPILKEAFADKLMARDRPFMESLVRDFLTQEAPALWETYREHFESREAFETGLDEFRRAAATLELQGDIDPALLGEVGGFDTLMTALDNLDHDEAARADLDLLMEVTEGLRKTHEPVKSIFEKVRHEVAP